MFSAFLYGGFLIPGEDIYWPLKIFFYILPIKYTVRSMNYVDNIDAKFDGCAKYDDDARHRGLWRYPRHPNYFGDACVWWGIWIAAASAGWWVAAATVIGPLFLTFTLTRWSGAPLLEGGMKKSRPGYAAYKARTSAFFPLPPKKSAG